MSATTIYEEMQELEASAALSTWSPYHPTTQELDAVLGPRWAICASSKSNMLRFGKCITLNYYEQVCRQIMEGRK